MIVYYCECGWQGVYPTNTGIAIKCPNKCSNMNFAIFTDEEWKIYGSTVKSLGMKNFLKANNLEFSVWPSKKTNILALKHERKNDSKACR